MVGFRAHWLLSLSHTLKILGLGKSMEGEGWLGKGEEDYVKSGMGTEWGARDKRWGHCGKGGRSSEGHKGIQVPALFLIYWLVSREACVPGKVGPQGYTGLPTQFSIQIPSYFLSPSCSVCLQIVLSACVCPYLPSSDGFLHSAAPPT